MRTEPEKKFLIIAPILGATHYWLKLGAGNTDNLHSAHKYGEKQSKGLAEKEPMLKLIPV